MMHGRLPNKQALHKMTKEKQPRQCRGCFPRDYSYSL